MPTQPIMATSDIRVAATVVLLRDAPGGPEVLLLERPHDRGSFAGAWVFPGGSVDAEDRLPAHPDASAGRGSEPEEGIARRAAVRELREETALEVSLDSLVLAARWTPPVSAPRRFRTWFYFAAAPAGEVLLSPEESVDHVWARPEEALERHAAGGLSLVAPTWVTLHGLTDTRSVSEALENARRTHRQDYATHIFAPEHSGVLFWQGDVAYDDAAAVDAAGDRHRLDVRTLPWVYSRSLGAETE